MDFRTFAEHAGGVGPGNKRDPLGLGRWGAANMELVCVSG